jgi:hypothetical protein
MDQTAVMAEPDRGGWLSEAGWEISEALLDADPLWLDFQTQPRSSWRSQKYPMIQ